MAAIKVKFKNDIRRVTLPEPISFVKLREILHVLYRSALPPNFSVKYIDDEGDHISITSDIELEEACAFVKRTGAPVMRMFITALEEDQSQSLSISSSSSSSSSSPSPSSSSTSPASQQLNKEEKAKVLREFDHSTQQTTIVTQSQLVSIQEILQAKKLEKEPERTVVASLTTASPQQTRSSPPLPLPQPEQQPPPYLQTTPLVPTPAPVLQTSIPINIPSSEEIVHCLGSPNNSGSTDKSRDFTAIFVADVGIQDGHVLPPKTAFVKTWRMENKGSQAWPEGTQLVYRLGDSLGPEVFPVQQLAGPGEQVDIYATLRSPSHPGRFIAYYRLLSPEGIPFGHRIWADIVVDDSLLTANTPTLIPTPVVLPEYPPEQQPQPETVVAQEEDEMITEQPEQTEQTEQPEQPQQPQQDNNRGDSPFSADFEQMIETMVSLGFEDRNVNANALLRTQGCVEAAINLLLDSTA